ncbi:alpha/beta hydrolase [Streptomyces sp. ACA25]|uniref:alpha/beta fold hydrolase n=1 Tax=Streptomyces sp. ACA25 TaxID=3022596 RepID=UPI002307F1F0|nr:alpha/beta hydrolase [Streptomyces sp. ACA25]MDB1088024.1 alpha/beta hydrolase [Streptomyces sp. ACA25]
MEFFTSYDGTKLAYHLAGDGPSVVCLPGGPMRAAAYLGDLGGLSAQHQLITLDLRGTGQSAQPEDPGTFRCDRLVDDVEALREHLGLDRMNLLGHSAGASLAALYTSRHPERVSRLALITPSVMAVGLTISGDDRLDTARSRRGKPWFPAAFAALEAIVAGKATPDSWRAIAPFHYGRWDEAARAHRADGDKQKNTEAATAFTADGAFDPGATRAALAQFASPVLLIAGDADPAAPPRAVAEFAELFPHAELVVQPRAGHFPWLDDADRFVTTSTAFLGGDHVPDPSL